MRIKCCACCNRITDNLSCFKVSLNLIKDRFRGHSWIKALNIQSLFKLEDSISGKIKGYKRIKKERDLQAVQSCPPTKPLLLIAEES